MKKILKCFILLVMLLNAAVMNAQSSAIEKLITGKKYKEAYALADKELAKTPNDAVLNFLKWEAAYYGKIDVKDNFRLLNRAIELDNTYSDAYRERADFFMQILRFSDAKEDIDAAVKYANTDSLLMKARLLLASYYSGTRQHQAAIAVNLEILKTDSLNLGALNNLAMGYQDVGEMDKALEILYRIEKIKPDANFVVINIGFVLTKIEDFKKAITYFDKAEKMVKNEPLVYSNRAYAKYKLKDYSGAMADINKSLKLFPSNSYGYRVRALIYIDQKNTDKACEDLNRALQLKYTEMYDDDVKQLHAKYCIQ